MDIPVHLLLLWYQVVYVKWVHRYLYNPPRGGISGTVQPSLMSSAQCSLVQEEESGLQPYNTNLSTGYMTLLQGKGSNSKRDSTSAPDVAARCSRSNCRLARTFRPNSWIQRWFLWVLRHISTHVLTIIYVSLEIHSFLRSSTGSGLVIAFCRVENH